MIIDTLRGAEYYFELHAGIESGFAFMSDAVRSNIEDGRYEIDGRNVYAIVSSCEGIGREKARLEAHRKYIDIHFCLEGKEVIGWSHVDDCLNVVKEYDKDKDIEFYSDKPASWTEVRNNTFGIFFPHDAHAPLAGCGTCRKLIIKIAFEE